jgi:peroxiredoxin
MVGKRAPDFAAQDPAGPWLPLTSLKDKPVALLFFRPGVSFAPELAREFGRFRDDSSFHPIVFLGIARDSMDRIEEFIKLHALTLPLLRDPGPIAPSYGIGDIPTVVLIDGDGIVRFRMDGYFGPGFQQRLVATMEALRKLPQFTADKATSLDLTYTAHPRAPVWSARAIDGKPIDLAALRGRVVVLNFFDQDCPHCQKDLPLLVPVLKEFRPRGVVVIGISSRDTSGRMREFMKTHGIDYPVVIDPGRAIFSQYDSTRTPDTIIIDKDGFIRFREHGDRPDRAEITRWQLRLLLGDDPKTLAAALPREIYSGDGVCRSCHEREYDDWLLTPHSIAWDSLEKGEKWRDPECVACHVTGKGRPGGFSDPDTTLHMVNVQCEVCHGIGGGHPAGAAAVEPAVMKTVCAGCHTGKFVLNFNPDEALALVAHQDHPDMDRLFKYSDAQRQRLQAINTRRLDKFKSGVAYVGADACRDCHAQQYQQWSRTSHAGAFAVILQAGRGYDASCTPCHTTGLGHKGGFGDPATKKGGNPMTNVQCEVCHGPGDDHVKAPAALKKATVYGITDQCSFCIIQGVCATCHDHKNDPRFDIEKALPRVRHRPDQAAAPAASRAR